MARVIGLNDESLQRESKKSRVTSDERWLPRGAYDHHAKPEKQRKYHLRGISDSAEPAVVEDRIEIGVVGNKIIDQRKDQRTHAVGIVGNKSQRIQLDIETRAAGAGIVA